MSIPSFLPYNVIIVYYNNILNVWSVTCKVCTEIGGLLSIMDAIKLYAGCVVCRPGERSTVNTTVNTAR